MTNENKQLKKIMKQLKKIKRKILNWFDKNKFKEILKQRI